MSLYVLGDLHLSFGVNKPMDVFGGRWEGYVDKLREGLSVLKEGDTIVLLGDLSWGLDLEQATEDFRFVNDLPGRKILVKGNHDYWWNTASKFEKFCTANGFHDLHLLHNNCYQYGDIAICGTRGWFFEEEKEGTHDEKVFLRELGRLETSLKAAGDLEKICFLHYPPRYRGYTCPEILRMLSQYGVTQCYYGHLHGDSHKLALQGESNGIDYRLASADFMNFTPLKIIE